MGVFERSNINAVVGLTFMGFTLTLAPVHEKIKRKKLFLFSMFCTSIISLLSFLLRLLLGERLHNIFEVCNRYTKSEDKEWIDSSIQLVDEKHQAVAVGFFAVVVFFIIIWFLLWSNESIVSFLYS